MDSSNINARRTMRTPEERRAEERRYEADVAYEVWRAGGNLDNINSDRVQRHMDECDPAEMAARNEIRHQRKREPEEPDTEQPDWR